MALLVAAPALAQDPPINYQDNVRPIIEEYCLGCHHGSRAKNGFKLDSVGTILEGGSSGAAVVPGDPDNSLLYQLISKRDPANPKDQMPPIASRVVDDDGIAAVEDWINSLPAP